MKNLWPILAGALLGVVLGIASLIIVLRANVKQQFTANGPWRVSQLTGSKDAGLYTRATVAVVGLFALSKEETIYYVASTDDRGKRLRASCTYEVTGKDLPARWWSLTAYNNSYYLIANAQNRYSFTMKDLKQHTKGQTPWRFILSSKRPSQVKSRPPTSRPSTSRPSRPEVLWLPTGNAKGLHLTLRLYNPSKQLLAHLKDTPLPRIKKLSCEGGR